jgi:hypothetical protein
MLQLCINRGCCHSSCFNYSNALQVFFGSPRLVHMICHTATSQVMAQARPRQSQPLWLGLRILEAKATGCQVYYY